MSTHILTTEQEAKLRKLARRVRKPYVAKVLMVPARTGIPGDVTLTTGSWQVFAKLVRMVKRIVPEYRGELKEHGKGWHYLDKSPYYYGEFFYLKDND